MLLFLKALLCIQDLSACNWKQTLGVICPPRRQSVCGLHLMPSSSHDGPIIVVVFRACQGLQCTFTHTASFDLYNNLGSGQGKDNYPYYTEGLVEVEHNCPCALQAGDLKHDLLASEHCLALSSLNWGLFASCVPLGNSLTLWPPSFPWMSSGLEWDGLGSHVSSLCRALRCS